jgi:hypothetical protein
MSNLYFTTINGESTGRASYFFRSKDNAQNRCNDQNKRAENMGIKARYAVVEHDGHGVEAKDIRD